MRQILFICFSLVILYGCTVQVRDTDPCADAPRTCWGQSGTSMADNPYCQKMTACFDWEAKAR